ncbi:hypothetical protein JTB14_031349 [Gonioctena quinquepunctata]|nr:hypothetical protein JTB14_031349 [Gonioctena quinquepunctata]
MSRKVLKTIGSSKPIRMWIDGKCFNLRQFKGKQVFHLGSLMCPPSETLNEPEKSTRDDESETDNVIGADLIITDRDGKLCTSFKLPSLYYMKLHQKEFLDLKAVSEKTGTQITVPRHGEEGDVVVKGENESNINEALTAIHSAVGQIRDRNVALQFISIPLLSDEIKSNFEIFKTKILSEEGINGVDETIFQNALKLHLTLSVFVLLDQREKDEAIRALEDYNTTILKPFLEKTGPLRIHVSGVECMNENYEKVDVVYAKAKFLEESEEVSLQNIANGLSDFFYERGLLKRHQETVKLHMTLMNSKYRKDPNSPSKSRRPKRKSFDARKIMEQYKDFEFGQCELKNIFLSLISSKGEDGFYVSLASIKV